MESTRYARTSLISGISAVFLLSCATTVTRDDYARATVGYVTDVNKLLVVDCLLPGQVRKLGTQLTYVSARRPIRTSAADCEVRGGEYVAYDRANYASALRIWEPQAASGDPLAQLYVGEIYEKGLGRSPDFKAAALWYRKSAEQGNQQAQINLGHLYETGRGVTKDPSVAAQYYARASGLDAAGLAFTAAPVKTAYPRTEATTSLGNVQREGLEAEKMRAQLREAELRILQQQNDLRASQNELEATRRKLADERSGHLLADSNIQQREKDLAFKEAQFRSQKKHLEEIERETPEAKELEKRLDDTQRKLALQEESLRAARKELEMTRRKFSTEKGPQTDDTTIRRQREAELRQKETQVLKEQGDIEKAAAALAEDRKRLATELGRLQQQRADADRLRSQLAEARKELEMARGAPSPSTLETQRTAQDKASIQKLREELEQKEVRLRREQAKLDEATASFKNEQQRARRELRAQSEQVARATENRSQAAPSPIDLTRRDLLAAEQELSDKLGEYQRQSRELTSLLTRSETPIDERSRAQIADIKRDLSDKAGTIKNLQERIDTQSQRIAELERTGPATGEKGPRIEIIEPLLSLTRGTPTIQLHGGISEIVGRVSSAAGIKSVEVNEKAISPDDAGMFKIPVSNMASSSPLRIAAVDKNGRRSDLNVRVASDTVVPPHETSDTPSSVRFAKISGLDYGRIVAILIGNNDYTAYPSLKTPASDAKSVDVILRERYGFTTKVLINATRHAIMSALNEINASLTERDNLLIYYAGHGEIDTKTNSGYWLPVDAEVGNTANWISNQSVTEWLSIMPAKHIIVVADSCYSGALSETAVAKLPARVDESKREKWLKAMSAHKARTVLTSGGVQPVLDQGGSNHSVFANAFLKVLRSNRGVIEDYEIYRTVMEEVASLSTRLGITQVPQYSALQHAGHEGSPFLFLSEG